jgi:hypothetical protein
MHKEIHVFAVGDFGRQVRDAYLAFDHDMDVIWHPCYSRALARRVAQNPTTRITFFENDLTAIGLRDKRKDLFLGVYYRSHCVSPEYQYQRAISALKRLSANLVLSQEVPSGLSMVVAPEETHYHKGEPFDNVLINFVDISLLRSHLHFTRSTVINANPVPWDSPLIYSSLRTVVDYCIYHGAYKPLHDVTAGHFAVKLDDNTFLTSRRRTNFNELRQVGLVKVITDGPDSVIAYGSKPSVGGQSQRIVFHEHKDYDCIVHFHCPIRPGSQVPVVSQREVECGSHECGKQTSRGLKRFGSLSAVYLDNHGPNIVFHHSIDPADVILFIEENFILEEKTGGYVSFDSVQQRLSA